MKKHFNKEELIIIQRLNEKKFKDIFFQPTKNLFSDTNLCIINFGNAIEYSFHVFCFVRIRNKSKLLLTSSDEYFTYDYLKLSETEYENQDAFEKSLLNKTISDVKEELKDSVVKKVTINNVADIVIEFNNDVVIEITTDCLYQDFEYYRFIDASKAEKAHYVVSFSNGQIMNEIIY